MTGLGHLLGLGGCASRGAYQHALAVGDAVRYACAGRYRAIQVASTCTYSTWVLRNGNPWHFACDLLPHSSVRINMPAGNKKSRAAKQKQEEGCTAFAKRATRPLSPNKSDYCPTTSDDDSDADDSATDVDSGDDGQRNNGPETSVVALRRLYAVFLPPHLRSNRDTLEKRRKINNRPAVYAGGSRTTTWRWNVAQRKAAEGCGTLDGYIQRKVGNRNDPPNEAPH